MNKMELAFFEEQYNSAVSLKDKYFFRTVSCLIITLAVGGLGLLSLPSVGMAVVQAAACALTGFIVRENLADGLRDLLRLSPTPGSFQALALGTEFIRGMTMALSESPETNTFFSEVILLGVALSMGMKYLYVLQVIKNLDLIRDKKTYAVQVTDLSLSKKYIRRVCTATPITEFPNVLRTSFESDPVQKRNRKFGIFVLLGILAGATVLSVIHSGTFLTAFSSFLILCSSFAAELAFNLPYILLQLRLRKLGSMLIGNYSIEHLKDTDTLLVKDTDLFPPENNEILNVRIRKPEMTDDILRYVSALLKLSESPMEEAFRKLYPHIPDKSSSVLQWRVIKNYGIVATVNIDNVLLGNRNLMLSHNLRPWSPDKEAMLTAAGVHMMYLAINGEIAATMIFRYGEDGDLKRSAEKISGDFNLLVDTKDCNVTESMIQRRYDLSHMKISVPDPDEAESVVETREEMEDDQSPPVMLSTRNALGILESIRRAKNLHRSVGLSITVQQLSLLFGLLLTFAGLLIAPDKISWIWLISFQILWTLPIPAIALFSKNR